MTRIKDDDASFGTGARASRIRGENTKQKKGKNKIVGSQLKRGAFEVKVDIRGILSRSSERR